MGTWTGCGSPENDSRDEPEDIDDADDKNHYQFWKSSKSQEEKVLTPLVFIMSPDLHVPENRISIRRGDASGIRPSIINSRLMVVLCSSGM